MNRFCFLLLCWLPVIPSFSQTDSSGQISYSAFVDVYYSYDLNQPENHLRPAFLYNHNRHNEFNINLAFLKVAYNDVKIRGNLALMAGTYAQYNLAAEPDLLQSVYEANAGVQLAKGWWLDAGIFASHIGLESAISKDNFTLTRSMAAENSPYYESGIKLTYAAGNQWVFTSLILNGWQNIQETPENSNKAIGSQIQFKPNDKILFNSSLFIGNEKPDNAKQWRYFHDFYATFQIRPNFKIATIFDLGAEERLASSGYNYWYTPALLLHYTLSDQLALAGRLEYYQDKHVVIISSDHPDRFKMSGYSLNIDYAPTPKVLLRVEGRLLKSDSDNFLRNTKKINKSPAITTSLAVSF